jgi:UDP-N-acetylmuramate dehydrogenase
LIGSPGRRGEAGALASELTSSIPNLRGSIQADFPMAPLSWFRTGGSAEALFSPADEDDLALFLAGCSAEIPVLVVGLGSNLLVRDGGVPGVVIRLGKAFGAISVEEGCAVRAGAGAPDVKVARAAAEAGIDGLTFLRGIPGAVGGALRMNGGAYGGETADVFVEARALDRQGRAHVLGRDDMAFSYRHCGAPGDLIFTEALFGGRPGDPAAILAAMNAITEARGATQPVNTRTGGSTFKNPPGGKAWELVDAAGCRGLRIGDAQVSELHCNFLINHGTATASEIEAWAKRFDAGCSSIRGSASNGRSGGSDCARDPTSLDIPPPAVDHGSCSEGREMGEFVGRSASSRRRE